MKQIARKHKNRQGLHFWGEAGYTLAELIVTFALLAIFMASVVMCLPKITKIYMNLQTLSHQKTICNTVSNLIRDELQVCLGVEELRDQLGTKVENENRNGYIVLLNDSGQPMPATGGGLTSPGAIKEDITGATLEFVRQDGIVAQIDTKGYAGYTMRKKKLQKAYLGNQVISSGALLTRYYELDKEKKKISSISYSNGGDYRVSSEAGIVTEGTQNVVYALQYPFAKNFYEGYDLKVDFTIKGDAFYGDGTTDRNYVKYVNYTLSLLKDGDVKYSQDYVVNIQNAVPYLQEKVTPDPVVPDVPGMGGTYVVPKPLVPIRVDNQGLITAQGYYDLRFHIERNSVFTNWDDYWELSLPEGLHLQAAFFSHDDDSNSKYSPIFTITPDRENDKIIISMQTNRGFIGESEFTIRFHATSDDGKLFEGREDSMAGVKVLHKEQRIPLADSINSKITWNWNSIDNHMDIDITSNIDLTKNYIKLEFDSVVDHVEAVWTKDYIITEVYDNVVYVYGRQKTNGQVDEIDLKTTFESTGTHNLKSIYLGNSRIYPETE